MLAKERQSEMIKMITAKGAVMTTELVHIFDVSIETIRRDLLELEKQGILQRVHGGAIKIGEMTERKNDALFTKYMTLLQDTVISCVIATNQTYVDTLKAQGKFDLEAQKVALQKTYDAVMAILTEDAVKYLNSVLGDFDAYVNTMIESQVNLQKVVVG